MHLRPYQYLVTNPNQIREWRGRYKGCKVKVFKKVDDNKRAFFIYRIEHQRGVYDACEEDGKTFGSKEEARDDAVKWIDFYSFLNSPLMALSHYK